MKYRIFAFVLAAAALAATALAQNSPCPAAARRKGARRPRSNVTEVTLGKNMLAFAAKFMNGKDKDEAGVRQLIEAWTASTSESTPSTRKASSPWKRSTSCASTSRPASGRPGARARKEEHREHRRHGQAGQWRVHGMFILTWSPKS